MESVEAEIMMQPGQMMGDRYRLDRKLGQNAGRQTWLAMDGQSDSQELVVVKLLAFADGVDWQTLRLFEREAEILRQLDHPKIPQYRDYFSVDDRVLWFGLVHRYIPGLSLKDKLTQGERFTEEQVHQIATEVLQILIYLHQLYPPVLHRDIKPSNLIWDAQDQIHLVDFGAVQDKAAVEGASFTVVGTYGYAPLEQYGGRATPASDLYALGATLIHLMTGVQPADLTQSNLRLQFAQLVRAKPALVRWLEKMTDPVLENRFQTAQVALNALQSNPLPQIVSPKYSLRELEVAPVTTASPLPYQVRLSKSSEELLIEWSTMNFPVWQILVYLTGVCGLLWALVVGHAMIFVLMVVLLSIGVLGNFSKIHRTDMVIRFDRTNVTVDKVHITYRTYAKKRPKRLKPNATGELPMALAVDAPTLQSRCQTRVYDNKTVQIQDVYLRDVNANDPEASPRWQLILQSPDGKYPIGDALDRETLVWLQREIRAWLRLGEDRTEG